MLPLLIIILTGIVNFLYLVPPVINWDEGTHGLWGYWVWLALREGNFGHFLALMRTQFAYPPLGSAIIGLTNLPFEFSLQLARFSSTIGFIVGGILIYLIAKQLETDSARTLNFSCQQYARENLPRSIFKFSAVSKFVIHLILNTKYLILLLFLTSPAILFYSVAVFKESWGLALTLLVIFLYFRALKKKTTLSFFWVGISLIFLFLTKYNYAVLIAITLLTEACVEFIIVITVIKIITIIKFIKRQLAIFLPLAVFSGWWILTPDNKMQWFLDIMRSDWNPVTVGVGSKIEYLLFYVNSIRTSYVFSEVLFWLLLVGFILAIKDLGNKKIRFLWVFFTINIVLGTIHSINLQDRYIYTAVPALFLVGGYEIIYIPGLIRRLLSIIPIANITNNTNTTNTTKFQYKNFIGYWSLVIGHWLLVIGYWLLVILLSLLLIKDIIYFPTVLKSNVSHMLLTAMYNETDYKDTLFDFDKSHWPHFVPRQARDFAGQAKIETPEDVFDYLLNNIDVNKPVEIVGYSAELSPDWWRLRVEVFKRQNQYNRYNNYKNYNRYIVTIEIKPTSRMYTYDYKRANAWQLGRIKEIEQQYKNNLVKEKDFTELGVSVKIYGL